VRTELVSIPTDTVPLDGAYHAPERDPPKGGVLLMHGNTMNFYTGAPRFLPPYLTELGYACLAYNRRGHDILTIRNSRAPEGAALQTAAEQLADNEYAAGFLAGRGHAQPIVSGHSNGGMLAVQFAAHHPETRALVLLSAHRGGQGLVRVASAAGLMAQDRVAEIREQATRLVAAGRGREFILLPGWWYISTAESFLDLCKNTPDTLEAAPRVRCPTLYVRGDREPAELYPAEEFQRLAGGPTEVVIIDECDHFYNGVEGEVARTVVTWLERTLPNPPLTRA
jgi:pimeloyl-ACP methyl ester carboxylesterase